MVATVPSHLAATSQSNSTSHLVSSSEQSMNMINSCPTEPATLLFVDDEPDMELLIRQRLRKAVAAGKLTLKFAQNGADAIELIEANSDIDVVLTDINMPVMDGLSLLMRLNEDHPLIKTVVVSAYGDMTNIRAAMNRGAFDFLTKPIERQDLITTLDRAIAKARQDKADRYLREQQTAELQRSEQALRQQTETLEQALQELQQAQLHLIQTEKMAALGQMVAGIAHEVNNPINFIAGNIQYIEKYSEDLLRLLALYQSEHPERDSLIQAEIDKIDLRFLIEDLPRVLASMTLGTERIQILVDSLRRFSRLDESDIKTANLHEGLDGAILILKSRLAQGISVQKEYGSLPEIECRPAQLNQVFMGILNNAIDALLQNPDRSPKQITIKTQFLEPTQEIEIQIADNGPGVPEDIRQRIFDPFFTTKPVGQGTGLGLAISSQIIDLHHGRLEVISQPDAGAVFQILLPLRRADQ